MGMGEPFLNYENVWKAIQIINDKDGFNIGRAKYLFLRLALIEGIRKWPRKNYK